MPREHFRNEDIGDVKSRIQAFRTLGDYKEGAAYFDSLPVELRQQTAVIIEVGQLFNRQGHYGHASAVLSSTTESPTEGSHAELAPTSQDQQHAALEVIRLFNRIMHVGDLDDILQRAEAVYNQWRNSEELKEAPLKSVLESAYNSSKFTKHNEDPRNKIAVANARLSHTSAVDEYHILLIYYCHRIFVTAAEQGLLDIESTKRNATKEFKALQAVTESAGRLREARFILDSRVELLQDLSDSSVSHILKDFLENSENGDFGIEAAMTMIDLAKWHRRNASKSAECGQIEDECMTNAEKILTAAKHNFGDLYLLEAKLQSSLSSNEIDTFHEKKLLAEEYLKRGCHMRGIAVLLDAVPPALRHPSLNQGIQESIEILRSNIEEVKAEYLKPPLFIIMMSDAMLKAQEFGHVLQALESYWKMLPKGIGPINHSIMAKLLSEIYDKFGDLEKAVDFSKVAFDILQRTQSHKDKSEAAFHLSLAYSTRSRLHAAGSTQELDWLRRSASLLENWIEKDSMAGFTEGQQRKCFRLAEVCMYLAQVLKLEGADEQAVKWLEQGMEIKVTDMPAQLCNYVIETQVKSLLRDNEYEKALAASNKALELCQRTMPPPLWELGQCYSRVATTRHFHFKYQMKMFQTHRDKDWSNDIRNLIAAWHMAFEALKCYRETNGAHVIVAATNHLWLIIEDIALFGEEQAAQIAPRLICELIETESFCDSIRRSALGTETLKSLMERRMLVSHKEHIKLYSAGVQTCLRLQDPSGAWLWVQKGKARALTDAFGSRAIVPQAIMNRIENDPDLLSLFNAERQAFSNQMHAHPEARLHAAREVEKIHACMIQEPLLKQVLDMREGAFDLNFDDTQLEESWVASGITKDRVKLVDWFIPRLRDGAEADIYLFVRSLSGSTWVRKLPISVQRVLQWIRRAFQYPDGAEPPLSKRNGNQFLAEMYEVVSGLEDSTSADDLLILSPAHPLTRVPIHGLKVGGKTLIDRNLVIYSTSSAILRHCLLRANQKPSSLINVQSSSFFAVYEETTAAGKAEQAEIYRNVDNLARRISGNVYKGTEVTKASFSMQAQKSGWIHYHGHAFYNVDDILKSALVLSDGLNHLYDEEPEASKSESANGLLTVKEIFDLRLMESVPHITTIACESGIQEIAAGDEPLGIISAMLLAGATSVLCCLWPIDSFAGRLFSEIFSQQQQAATFTTKNEDQERSVLNTAIALRFAVRKMRMDERTRQPHYWAPFVLHGSWFWTSEMREA